MTRVSIELRQRLESLISKYKTSTGVFGFVWNPEDHCIYLDNPSKKGEQIVYADKVMNALAWAKGTEAIPAEHTKGLAAAASYTGGTEIHDVFFGPFAELADCRSQDIRTARKTQDAG